MPLGKTVDDIDILALDIAEFLQALYEGIERRIVFFRDRAENCDEWALGRDLCARRERPTRPPRHPAA